MDRKELLDKLTEVLTQYDDNSTSINLHLTFTHVGNVHNIVSQPVPNEVWWDENFQLFIDKEPQ